MSDFSLSWGKKYLLSTFLIFILVAQTIFSLFLYFTLQDLKRATENNSLAPLPTYTPLTPTLTLKEAVNADHQIPSRAATPSAQTGACTCPLGPQGPAGEKGEKGEKGDKGDSGTADTTGGRWAVYCQSRLGPVRQKPSYGCDKNNANDDWKESEFQVWVK